jgi:uncharacterized protein (DUF362 family)
VRDYSKVPRVLLRRCDEYDPARIRAIITEGLDELGIRPAGRTLVKPNCVIAHDLFFPHAYTRAEMLDGLLGALRARGDAITELAVGERCGITIPTRFAFAQAHYGKVLRRHRVKAHFFDEQRQVRRDLFAAGRLRDYVYVPEAVSRAEFFVDAPKFKAHPWTKVTFNLKNYIGIQDDAHRLIDHDHHLHTKVADLYEVVQPKLCIVDGIIAGAKTMLTPRPFPLGLIIIGDDAVATDAVCCSIIGVDPRSVDHLRITAERGWGTLDLGAITIDGDVTLEEAQVRGRGFELSLDKIDRTYNGKSRLRIYLGPPPDTYDYCSGGCPGALDEAVGIVERLQPNARHESKPMHLVYGAYQGEISPPPGERVVFIGDCARWKGKLDGQDVDIPYLYKERGTIMPERARAQDLPAKIWKSVRERWLHRKSPYVRIRGCPVSVAENALLLAAIGGTKNPYWDMRMGVRYLYYYVLQKLMRALAELRPAPVPAPSRPPAD